MTQEEKAKAYDEALDRARKMLDMILNNELLGFPGQIREIFPQLRESESEDERIRKALIEALKSSKNVGELKFVLPYPTREECIAYLEKQKDLDKMIVVSPEVWDNAISDAYENGKKEGEKQKEQKHPNGCFTCDEYKKGYEEGRRNGFTAGYNKAMKEVEQKEQKPSCWNSPVMTNEMIMDEQKPDSLIYDKDLDKAAREFYLSGGADSPVDSTGLVPIVRMAEFGATWMKDRMEKEQKPAEWSEEDEEMIGNCIDLLEHFPLPYGEVIGPWKDCIAWLKSLPERFNLQSKQEQNDYITPHKEFFKFIYDRLINVHKEDPNVDYMRSFKERLNNLSFGEKQEWSDEDEIRRESCMLYLANARDGIEFSQYIGDKARESGKKEIQKDIDWLKSLRPSWKPSEEQMKMLAMFANLRCASRQEAATLESLYNDLKKLM